MFSSSKPNYLKLRTNLRLCINRLKLLEKKKTELALKARKEIADYISAGKEDRARIRVEHIVREDYMVEAMEIVEMFCDLILARYGLIERMKELDPGLEEAIATIIWVTLRLSADVPELKEVTKQFTIKYGKEYAEMCRTNGFENVNEKVMHKLSMAAPPKMLIENYMVEIARTYKVDFEPDMAALEDHRKQPASNSKEKCRDLSMNFGQSNDSSQSPGTDGILGAGEHWRHNPAEVSHSATGSGDPSDLAQMLESVNLKASHTLQADHFPAGIRAAHLNIRSLCGHYSELSTLLKNKPLHILALSETWLDDTITDEEVAIVGYTLVRKDRNRSGGGVMFYVMDNMTYSVDKHTTVNLEAISIHIQAENGVKVVFTNIYKPPSDSFNDFLSEAKRLLCVIKGPSTLNLIMGDFNCDILNAQKSNANQLLKIMADHELINVIKEATRVTTRSSTCIDLIFTNAQSVLVSCGVEKVGMSDHFMPFIVLSTTILNSSQSLYNTTPLQMLNMNGQIRHNNYSHIPQDNSAEEASDLIDIDPDFKRRPPGGGSGGGGGTRLGFDGIGGPQLQPQAPGPGALYGASGGMSNPDNFMPQGPGAGVFPNTELPPKTVPPYQPSDSLPSGPPSYMSSGGPPPGQLPPAGREFPNIPSHPPNAGCNRGLPPPVLPPGGTSGGWHTNQNGGISGSAGAPLPTYNDALHTPPAQKPNAPPGGSLGIPDLPDVPGLPSVPSSTIGMGSAGGEDVDFDDLTKRFEQLKKHK